MSWLVYLFTSEWYWLAGLWTEIAQNKEGIRCFDPERGTKEETMKSGHLITGTIVTDCVGERKEKVLHISFESFWLRLYGICCYKTHKRLFKFKALLFLFLLWFYHWQHNSKWKIATLQDTCKIMFEFSWTGAAHGENKKEAHTVAHIFLVN